MIIRFLILCVFIIPIIFFIDIAFWLDDCSQINNKIKFKAFKNFYNVNPDRWNLYDGYVGCVDPHKMFNIKFKFNYYDWHRYKAFLSNRRKIRDNIKANKDCAKMIELVRSDIAALETKAQSDMQAAAQNLKDITARM